MALTAAISFSLTSCQDEISENTGGEVEVELDPEDVEISLDELVAQTLGDMQEELDARSAAIADMRSRCACSHLFAR